MARENQPLYIQCVLDHLLCSSFLGVQLVLGIPSPRHSICWKDPCSLSIRFSSTPYCAMVPTIVPPNLRCVTTCRSLLHCLTLSRVKTRFDPIQFQHSGRLASGFAQPAAVHDWISWSEGLKQCYQLISIVINCQFPCLDMLIISTYIYSII